MHLKILQMVVLSFGGYSYSGGCGHPPVEKLVIKLGQKLLDI